MLIMLTKDIFQNENHLTAGLGENTNENKGIGGKGNLWE